jgi:hypothetical protein
MLILWLYQEKCRKCYKIRNPGRKDLKIYK